MTEPAATAAPADAASAAPVALPLPSLYEFEAPEDWRSVEFISDVHLSDQEPATFDAWRRYLATTDADAVVMLGDLFEVWVGDDSRFGDFEARCLDVLADAATRLHVAFMVGNRDFLVGRQMLDAIGAIGMSDPTVLVAWGQRVLLTHGDLLCQTDTAYQAFRRRVRSSDWMSHFLAQPLQNRRDTARAMRDASERHKAAQAAASWVDVDCASAVCWMHAAGARDLIHGHTHHPVTEILAPGFTRHVLGDWDADARPPRAEALRLTRNGFERRPVRA